MTTYLRVSIVERIERDDWATNHRRELDLWTIIELQDALEAECSSCLSSGDRYRRQHH